MRINDLTYNYDVCHLAKISDKDLKKQFSKLRKKFNSIQKIKSKIQKNEKVNKEEQMKFDNRHETVFLYYRLKYYDMYYLNGHLNLHNNFHS